MCTHTQTGPWRCVDRHPSPWTSLKRSRVSSSRPAHLVQIALTFLPHMGAMFLSLPLSSLTERWAWTVKKTVTFAHEQKDYFLILCNADHVLSLQAKWRRGEHHVCLCVFFMFIYSIFSAYLIFQLHCFFVSLGTDQCSQIFFPLNSPARAFGVLAQMLLAGVCWKWWKCFTSSAQILSDCPSVQNWQPLNHRCASLI